MENIKVKLANHTFTENAVFNAHDWNGWACPMFTKDQAFKVIDKINEDYGEKAYEIIEDGEKIILKDYINDEIEEVYSMEYNNTILYGIGYGSWCWETVEDEQEQQ